MDKIKVYTLKACPRCKMLKMKLKQKHVDFEEIDITDSYEELGIKSAPTLEVGGEHLSFKEANEWINKI